MSEHNGQPPRCPAHPDQPMYPHPRGWAWLCPIERGQDQASPQPSRLAAGAWRPIPLARVVAVGRSWGR